MDQGRGCSSLRRHSSAAAAALSAVLPQLLVVLLLDDACVEGQGGKRSERWLSAGTSHSRVRQQQGISGSSRH